MAHSNHKVNLKQPRVVQIMEVLQSATDGLKTPQVAQQLGMGERQARRLLVAMKGENMIALVGASSSAWWCLHGMAKRIAINVRDKSLVARRQRARRIYAARVASGIVCSATGRAVQSIDAFEAQSVQRIVQVWPPLQRLPGPPSVFHLGGML